MLVIRKEQMQAFIAGSEADLARIIRRAIRSANEERVKDYDDNELDAMLKIGMARARSHGLTGAEDIAAFIAIMFEVAPRFDEHPDIKAVLNDGRFSPALRFEQLFSRVADDAWVAAGRLYDDSFWFPNKI